MKKDRLTYLLLGFLLFSSACDLTNNSSFTTKIELINQTGEKIYYWILDEDTASRIDILPTIDPEEISLPELLENESIGIDLNEIENFPIEKLDQGIHIILYTIRDSYLDSPGPIAVGGHYGNISYNELKRNQGKIILKNQ